MAVGAVAAAMAGGAGAAGAAGEAVSGQSARTEYDPRMLEAVARLDSVSLEDAAARLDKEAEAYEAVMALRASTNVDGFFMDDNAQMLVNVTSESAAQQAKLLGLVPRFAVRGESQLNSLAESVFQRIHASPFEGFRGIAIDLSQDRIVVKLAPSPAADRLSQELQAIAGVSVKLDDTPAEPTALHIGGNEMWNWDGGSDPVAQRCTQGFSGSRPDGTKVILIAGHCLEHDRYSYTTNNPITSNYLGQRIGQAFQTGAPFNAPTLDAGLVALTPGLGYYTSINARYPTDPNYVPMAAVKNPFPDQTVCKIGDSSGFTCGRVVTPWSVYIYGEAPNPVTYVRSLWESTICSIGGDSSGPIISGNFAVGLVSGGRTLTPEQCPWNNGPTYAEGTMFTPVWRVLQAYPGTVTNF